MSGLEEDTVLLAKACGRFVQFYHDGLKDARKAGGVGGGGGKECLFADEEEEDVMKGKLEREGEECLRIANLCVESEERGGNSREDSDAKFSKGEIIDNATVLAEGALKWLDTLKSFR